MTDQASTISAMQVQIATLSTRVAGQQTQIDRLDAQMEQLPEISKNLALAIQGIEQQAEDVRELKLLAKEISQRSQPTGVTIPPRILLWIGLAGLTAILGIASGPEGVAAIIKLAG